MRASTQHDVTVVDRSFMDTLLLMAVEEGLLSENHRADGYIGRIKRRPIPQWVREQVLEQVVLSGQIVSFNPGWGSLEAFDGKLLEADLLAHLNPVQGEPDWDHVPAESLLGMLHARGILVDIPEVMRRIEASSKALEEEEAFKRSTGKVSPTSIEGAIARAMVGLLRSGEPFTEEEIAAQEKRNRTYEATSPILDSITEFLKMRKAANEDGLMTRTALFSAGGSFIPPPSVPRSELITDPVKMLRVVAGELGRLTFRPTLKESLTLRKDPATLALRERLRDWLHALQGAEVDHLARIRSDIIKARKSLMRGRVAGKIGDAATWLAAPAAVADVLLTLPGILGGATTVVAISSLTWRNSAERKHRWAMFGGL